MREIITQSGTVYTLEDGRITRQGDNTTVPEVINRTFRFMGPAPEIGKPFSVNVFGIGIIAATKVVKIENLNNYCASHDIFDCPFDPPR